MGRLSTADAAAGSAHSLVPWMARDRSLALSELTFVHLGSFSINENIL